MPVRAASAAGRHSESISAERVQAAPRLRVLTAEEFDAPGERLGDIGASYAWVMAATAAVIAIVSAPGQTYGFTFFNPWLRQSLRLSQTVNEPSAASDIR